MNPFEETTQAIQSVENHKLHVSGIAKVAIEKGQLLKLDGETGEIDLFVPGTDLKEFCIGIAVTTAAIGDSVTYAANGYAVIKALWGADSSLAGPVSIEAGSYADGRYTIEAGYTVGEDDAITMESDWVGWALSNGDDGDEVEVILVS